MELGQIITQFEAIQTEFDRLNELSPEELDAELSKLEDDEPKYEWRNGARVRVN